MRVVARQLPVEAAVRASLAFSAHYRRPFEVMKKALRRCLELCVGAVAEGRTCSTEAKEIRSIGARFVFLATGKTLARERGGQSRRWPRMRLREKESPKQLRGLLVCVVVRN